MTNFQYEELILEVEIYAEDVPNSGNFAYRHINQSPYMLTVSTFGVDYCTNDKDFVLSGMGYQKRTAIVEQSSLVVAGQPILLKIAPKNIFYKQFLQSNFDPIDNLFLLEMVPIQSNQNEMQSCVCSPYRSKLCEFFSGSYEECSHHANCEWIHDTDSAQESIFGSCVACNKTEACLEDGGINVVES